MSAWDNLKKRFFGGAGTGAGDQETTVPEKPTGTPEIIETPATPVENNPVVSQPQTPVNTATMETPEEKTETPETTEQPAAPPVTTNPADPQPEPVKKKSIFEMDENNTVDFNNLVKDFKKPKKEFTGKENEAPEEETEQEQGAASQQQAAKVDEDGKLEKAPLTPDEVKKLSEVNAKAIIKTLDYGGSYGAMFLAGEAERTKYKFDEEETEDLMVVWSNVLEYYKGGSAFIMWFGVAVITLFAFGSKLWMGWSDKQEKAKNKRPPVQPPSAIQQQQPGAPAAQQQPVENNPASEQQQEAAPDPEKLNQAIAKIKKPGMHVAHSQSEEAGTETTFSIPQRPTKGRLSAYEKKLVDQLKSQQEELQRLRNAKVA